MSDLTVQAPLEEPARQEYFMESEWDREILN